MTRFPQGYARYDISMSLSRIEYEHLVKLIQSEKDSEFKKYVLSRLSKAKER